MFGKFLSFVLGLYAGVFADQHYKLPKLENPQDMWDRLKVFMEEYKKEHPGPKSD